MKLLHIYTAGHLFIRLLVDMALVIDTAASKFDVLMSDSYYSRV